jgi:hypothetical protein
VEIMCTDRQGIDVGYHALLDEDELDCRPVALVCMDD